MNIGGFLKFSMIDYPSKLSAVVFCQGCSLRCDYCHNKNLQPFVAGLDLNFQEILQFLSKRVGTLDAVVFSGGEPLLQHDLIPAIKSVKDLGFLIGLHTSGIAPDLFEAVVGLCDWIGFDIKTAFEQYSSVTNTENSGVSAQKSFEILVEKHCNFEVRTTFDSRHISEDDLFSIARMLKQNKIRKWILQECILRNDGELDSRLLLPDSKIVAQLSDIIEVETRK